ncbi:FHA domain protein [Aspergillus lucknowensis]|uniref:FHA domain protein n=1 Tax=Aspergillus lucknowensis TaxID=176173 RepID=A0ABR4LL60_9EURO
MMAASVSASTSTSISNPLHGSSDNRSGPLRRLSQLRAYTQTHFSSQNHSSTPSTSSSTSNPQQRPARRHSISGRRLSWFSPHATTRTDSAQPTPADSSPCPEPRTQSSTQNRYSAIFFPAPRGFETDVQSPPQPSEHSESTSSVSSTQPTLETMARLRSSSQNNQENPSDQPTSVPAPTTLPTTAIDSPDPVTNDSSSSSPSKPKRGATIRFFPHQDSSQSSRPSLPFIPVSRTLPSDTCSIRVGRYSERDGLPVPNPSEPSDAPVGFKSKVVSRKHCEFLYLNGLWHIKDVGSSSGTFLNHMRLSQPNMPSRLYTVKDGDIVQLGIDFRGGEEMIFRCVRLRIECNRGWQQQPNEFNKNTESLIKNLGKGEAADYSGCRECSICLGSVLRPYQCLFMAACAHVWHYKCVSRLIHTPDYPMFQCPNCRAYTDLSAEVDDSNDYEAEGSNKQTGSSKTEPTDELRSTTCSPQFEPSRASSDSRTSEDRQTPELATETGLAADVENMRLSDNTPSGPDTEASIASAPNSGASVPGWQSLTPSSNQVPPRQAILRVDTPMRSESSDENPLTPLNESGPLAFDGRAGMP